MSAPLDEAKQIILSVQVELDNAKRHIDTADALLAEAVGAVCLADTLTDDDLLARATAAAEDKA